MKKFTLLAGLALAASAAFAADEVNGLKMSVVNNAADLTDAANQMNYYRISNMRIQRLSYITGKVFDQYGYDTIDDANVIGTDGSTKSYAMPKYLPGYYDDGTESEEGLTPELFEEPYRYMGLANYGDQWWIGFSSIDEIVNPSTRFWYFTEGKTAGTVLIHNAVQGGSVKRDADKVTFANGGKFSAMAFNTKDNQYFVQPVREALEEEGFEMSLTDEQLDVAFALSTSREFTTTSDKSLDVNNYVTYTMAYPKLDEVGDTVVDADGDTVYTYYGFVGADRTWSPIRSNGQNQNHEINNGTIWFVESAETADANKAIEEYKSVVEETYRQAAINLYTQQLVNVAASLEAYTNLPGLIKDQTALQAIIARCSNPTVDASSVKSLEDVDAFEDKGVADAQAARAEAMGLIGNGAVVRLQQQFALRDYDKLLEYEDDGDLEAIAELALGNAWVSAGCDGWFNNGGERAITGYPAIGPVIEDTEGYDPELTEWELIPVWNTTTFKLYNKKSNSYIMTWNEDTLRAMTQEIWNADPELEGTMSGSADLFTWATTENPDDAAAFELVPCPDAERQAAVSASDSTLIEEQAINTSVIDNVRLTCVDPKTDAIRNLHRATFGSDYKFENYTPTAYRWYAESNIFHIEVVTEGGIQEVDAATAPKNKGIFDLQGRRVSKAQKGGLYIVDGVKTIIR